jgi:AraC family transcriptional regulator of adaptative response/methylated-DNA-[protein]-cysteine methyltransferase
LISDAVEPVKVDALAEQLGISRFHLQKLFQQFLGIGPKQYIKAVRASQLSKALDGQPSVTEALFEAGYDSSSAYYADGATRIGMSARTYRRHGEGMQIRYAFGNSRFGQVIVAATERGVCSILFGDTQAELAADLRDRFSKATIVQDTKALSQLVVDVLAGIEHPELASQLPLDIQGTAFQEKVWVALRNIAPGDTATYSEIAARIGKPTAARAVATACAANPIAVIVPCHRVVRTGGDVSGYRWGVERKKRLLAHEVQSKTEEQD